MTSSPPVVAAQETAAVAAAAAHHQPRRWVVLVAFLLVAGLSQAVWLNFAPLVTQVEATWQVSEAQAGLLVLVFPLLYVLVSIPAGVIIDRRGYRFAVNAGGVVMAVCALLRIVDLGFWWLLVLQIGMAIAQPFVVNSISKLVLDWFSPEQGALATGLGTMGMFMGMAAGIASTPPMVAAWGMQGAMAAWAAISVGVAVTSLALLRENPLAPARPPADRPLRQVLGPLLSSRPLVVVFAVAGLGLGYFNGLTAWIEPVLARNGLDAVQAGMVGGVIILGGIVGAGVIPALSDHLGVRKRFVLGSVAGALLTLWPVVGWTDYNPVLIASFFQGFFFLPAFALLLEICSELAGQELAGAATAVLMLAGNAGGVLVMLGMVGLSEWRGSWDPAVALLFVVLLLAGLGAALLPETGSRKAQPQAADG